MNSRTLWFLGRKKCTWSSFRPLRQGCSSSRLESWSSRDGYASPCDCSKGRIIARKNVLSWRSILFRLQQCLIVFFQQLWLLLLRKTVYATFVKYSINLFVKNLIYSLQVSTDRLGPKEIAFYSLSVPLWWWVIEKTSIVADLVGHLDKFGFGRCF